MKPKRYCFRTDDSGHWYKVDLDNLDTVEQWLDIDWSKGDSYDKDPGELPLGCERLEMGIQHYSFCEIEPIKYKW